jgi:hypothetical protein
MYTQCLHGNVYGNPLCTYSEYRAGPTRFHRTCSLKVSDEDVELVLKDPEAFSSGARIHVSGDGMVGALWPQLPVNVICVARESADAVEIGNHLSQCG